MDGSNANAKKSVELYTDGACIGNPGAGGWGTILRYRGRERELCGGEALTTNNRMELTAVIEGLKALKEPCAVTLYTDSKYVADSIAKRWVYLWLNKGWMRSGKPVPNSDLWQQLLPLLERHELDIQWVKGHAGHPENERCDAMSVKQAKLYNNRLG